MKFKSPYADLFKETKEPKTKEPKEPKIRYRFELSIDYADKEIIEELEKHPNKSEYVRQLIRQDIGSK